MFVLRNKKTVKDRFGFTPTPNFGVSLYSKRGFTLIELLVVIAVIGFLASMAVYALNVARIRARDARRMSDIKQISTAIELYYDEYGNYPRTAGWCTQISNPLNNWGRDFQADIAEWLPKVPLDPAYHDSYQDYFYMNIGDQSYYLYAELETIDRTEDGLSACAKIDGINNEYDLRYPSF